MRIMLVAPMAPQAHGNGAIPVLLYAELTGLRERHEVTLITAIGDEPGEEEAARALTAEGVDLRVADRRRPAPGRRRFNRRLRLAATWGRGRWPWRTVWFADPGIQAAIDHASMCRSFDVVAVEDNSMAVFRLPEGVPAVLTEHEVQRPRELARHPASPAGSPLSVLRELDRRRWSTFQPSVWRFFDRVQVFSESEAQAVQELAPDVAPRVRVNPFGLVPPAPLDPTREQPGTVLFVGNFTHPPNHDAAVWLTREIMPAVRARFPSARLRIVGASPPPEVMRLAGPDSEVVADAPDLRPHLEAACVVLAPVRIGGGMRMKVLHALASGKPVVTTTRGTEGYAMKERAAPLIVADDAEGIASATAELLADDDRRRALGARGRSFALEHHTPAAWAARLEAVYEEAISTRRSRL